MLKVHNETNYPPFNFNVNGRPRGISIDYMNLLASRLGIKIHYVSGPSWSQFLRMMRSGELDVMLNIISTPQRERYLNFTEPYAETHKAIFTNDPRLGSLKRLIGHRV
ncbi:transporter substrate-binding domain-containing protein, partial [Nitratifractor sp.]